MQSISVVVPVYNEEESVKECYLEISKVLESMGRSYEIIFVNDGSKDNTLEVLKECAKIAHSFKKEDAWFFSFF